MTASEFWGSAVYLAMAIAIALVVFLLVRRPMRRLLGMNSRLERTGDFFVRALLLTLLLVAGAVVAGEIIDPGENAAFMQYVWQAAGGLNGVFAWTAVVLVGYVIVAMILAVGLGRRGDE